MKQMMVLSMALFCLAACAQTKKEGLSPEEKKIVGTEVAARVEGIYDDVCSWYNKQVDLLGGNDFDKRYLTMEFNKLIAESDEISQKNEVLPPNDYDHWIQAQDWEEISARVDSVNVLTADTANVFLTITNMGEKTALEVVMAKSVKQGDKAPLWYIDDFITSDFSERAMLKEFIDEMKAQ